MFMNEWMNNVWMYWKARIQSSSSSHTNTVASALRPLLYINSLTIPQLQKRYRTTKQQLPRPNSSSWKATRAAKHTDQCSSSSRLTTTAGAAHSHSRAKQLPKQQPNNYHNSSRETTTKKATAIPSWQQLHHHHRKSNSTTNKPTSAQSTQQ